MPRLKSRDRQIPNGLFFYEPATRWKSSPGSFENIVQQIIAHRNGNRSLLVDRDHLPTDHDGVANELDNFAANVCAQLNWTEYIVDSTGGSPPPKMKPPTATEISQLAAVGQKAKEIWAGIKTLNAWLDSGEPAVDRGTAECRAVVCVTCPLNGQGDLSRWFTVPAAGAIKRQLEKLHERQLATSVDEQLNICEACLCPMKLKVWTPMKFIKANLSDAVLDKLRGGKDCWILKELAA